MLLTGFKLTGRSTLNLLVQGASPSDKYIFKGADGLGPTETDIFYSDPLEGDAQFNNSKPRNREIVFRVGLNPDWGSAETPAQLRENIYRLTGSGALRFSVMNAATEVCYTTGRVSKVEIVPFTKDPEVQLTIPCNGPYFKSPTTYAVPLGGLSKTAPVIDNIGTAPVGFYFDITFTAFVAAIPALSISSADAQGGWLFNGRSFQSGDRLVLSSEIGSKNAYVITSGGTVILLSYLSMTPPYGDTWPKLESGLNTFAINKSTFNYNDVHYTPQFKGI